MGATSSFVTKELSKKTWPDYQRFFSQGNGWDHCGCTWYHGVRARGLRTFAEQRDFNLNVKCDLVERRLAHGILVYANREPIGWCQFGSKDELPIAEHQKRRPRLLPDDTEDNVWRITCFCTVKEYREQGVAELALRAALKGIRKRGGGVVKSYPIVTLPNDPRLDELVRAHGGNAREVLDRARKQFGATDVVAYDRKAFSVGGVSLHGFGPLWALVRRVPGVLHPGTVAMFEREGFKASGVIGPTSRKLPSSRLVMQRTVRR